MGLDASVRCNCFELGLTKPPPIPKELICRDEEGWLVLSPSVRDNWEVERAFIDWLLEADTCEHGMALVSVTVANGSGYRTFQEALDRAGWEHFPVLHEHLPEGNGGSMSASFAPAALKELRYFQEDADLGTSLFLIDSETGEELWVLVEGYGGQFIWSGSKGHNIGFDEDGLWIRTSSEHPTVMFRSKSFEQRLFEPEQTKLQGDGRVEYVDLQTGYRYICPIAIACPEGKRENDGKAMRFRYPRFMNIRSRPITSDHFDYIIKPLTEVFEAAIATGNPIAWL